MLKKLSVVLLVAVTSLMMASAFAQGVDSKGDVANDLKQEREQVVFDQEENYRLSEESLEDSPWKGFKWLPWILGLGAVFFMIRAVFNLRKILRAKHELLNVMKHEDDFNELLKSSKQLKEGDRPLSEEEQKAFTDLVDRLLTSKTDTPIHKMAKDRFKKEVDAEMARRRPANRSSGLKLIKGGKDEITPDSDLR